MKETKVYSYDDPKNLFVLTSPDLTENERRLLDLRLRNVKIYESHISMTFEDRDPSLFDKLKLLNIMVIVLLDSYGRPRDSEKYKVEYYSETHGNPMEIHVLSEDPNPSILGDRKIFTRFESAMVTEMTLIYKYTR